MPNDAVQPQHFAIEGDPIGVGFHQFARGVDDLLLPFRLDHPVLLAFDVVCQLESAILMVIARSHLQEKSSASTHLLAMTAVTAANALCLLIAQRLRETIARRNCLNVVQAA
jgi:hypothetical protein